MALRTLWDSPHLAPLARAAEKADVEVELFGSVATRALLFDAIGVAPKRISTPNAVSGHVKSMVLFPLTAPMPCIFRFRAFYNILT